jgi:hypothetical protein|tara:strand:+ start:1156 stop:1440 length:285 start_codon:yes stop_codon:yes gene_type:complete
MKKIRATLTIEVPYSNELMNYGKKLDKELRKVIDNTDFLNCKVVAGESFGPPDIPVLTLDADPYSNRARPDGFEFRKIQDNLRGMYIPEYKDET